MFEELIKPSSHQSRIYPPESHLNFVAVSLHQKNICILFINEASVNPQTNKVSIRFKKSYLDQQRANISAVWLNLGLRGQRLRQQKPQTFFVDAVGDLRGADALGDLRAGGLLGDGGALELTLRGFQGF